MSPGIDHLIVTFVVGDETHVIVHHDLFDFLVTAFNQLFLFLRDDDITQVEGQTAFEGHLVTQVLDSIQEFAGTGYTDSLDNIADDVTQRLLGNDRIDISTFCRHDFVNDHTTNRSFLNHLINNIAVFIQVFCNNADDSMDIYLTFVVSNQCFFRTVEDQAFTFSTLTQLGDVIQTQYHILSRHCDRRTIRRVQNIMSLEHQHLCFQNCFVAQRQVNSHLVTVEVGIERRTCQRVQLNSFSFDHLRLESLNTQTVKCRRTVQQYRMTLHYVFSHQFRNTAFTHLQFRTYDDNRTGRIVNTLTQQVLTETSLLTFQAVRKRFQRTVGISLHCT